MLFIFLGASLSSASNKVSISVVYNKQQNKVKKKWRTLWLKFNIWSLSRDWINLKGTPVLKAYLVYLYILFNSIYRLMLHTPYSLDTFGNLFTRRRSTEHLERASLLAIEISFNIKHCFSSGIAEKISRRTKRRKINHRFQKSVLCEADSNHTIAHATHNMVQVSVMKATCIEFVLWVNTIWLYALQQCTNFLLQFCMVLSFRQTHPTRW